MEPTAFDSGQTFIRWVLTLCEDKAGPWAVRQLQRMELEVKGDGRCLKEHRKWKHFRAMFVAQFGDPGLKDKARQQWKEGLNQTGRAVDYFELIETILLRLGYERDAAIVMDQVQAGLRPHIREKFISRTWPTLNQMKEEVIPFDAAWDQIKKSDKKGGKRREGDMRRPRLMPRPQ
jgi:hypothetical protein